MQTVAVLPIKSFALAKRRLGAAVDAPTRAELASTMVADVLDALAASRGLDRLFVVTASPPAVRAAQAVGATVVEDRTQSGHSDAASLGIAAAVRSGARRVLLVPGDCPTLHPDQVGALLAGSRPSGVVIVADRHGIGTNALLLEPPDAIEPAFGPGSFERHRDLAARAGVGFRVAEVPSLQLDIDTAEDIRALRTALADPTIRAVRTRALLDRLDLAMRAR